MDIMSAYSQIMNSNLQYGLSMRTEVSANCPEEGYIKLVQEVYKE